MNSREDAATGRSLLRWKRGRSTGKGQSIVAWARPSENGPGSDHDRGQEQVQPQPARIMEWLAEIVDPEIPILSIVDLGIVRRVEWRSDALLVSITPTYSGCPAMRVIEGEIRKLLSNRGIEPVELITQLSPAWTTDWLSERGRERLVEFGIAPPAKASSRLDAEPSGAQRPAAGTGTSSTELRSRACGLRPFRAARPEAVKCPRCGSGRTVLKSQFGSTPCKALYGCLDCLEPFDYFKCH